MTPDQLAAALLLAAEPTDRALRGWRHPVWTGSVFGGAALVPGLAGFPLPSGWALKWLAAVRKP